MARKNNIKPEQRYPFFNTPEELSEGIEQYFAMCAHNKRLPNIELLSHSLGFLSRQSIHDYKQKPEFSDVINRALLFIAGIKMDWLQNGMGSTAGIIFSTCNDGMGYQNPQRIEISGPNGGPIQCGTVVIGGGDRPKEIGDRNCIAEASQAEIGNISVDV